MVSTAHAQRLGTTGHPMAPQTPETKALLLRNLVDLCRRHVLQLLTIGILMLLIAKDTRECLSRDIFRNTLLLNFLELGTRILNRFVLLLLLFELCGGVHKSRILKPWAAVRL